MPMSAAEAARPGELNDAQIQELLHVPPIWTRRDVQRSFLIALISTLVIGGGLIWLISQSSGWASVHKAFFSWKHFRAALPLVWQSFKLNIKIFMIAEPIVLIAGLVLAIMRNSRSPVLFPIRAFAVVYIDMFRGLPALLVILILGFGVPALRLSGVSKSPVIWGSVAIILTSAAYTAETFRAGIESVHASQRAAARSLGLNSFQSMRYIVLPQAIRTVIPPLLSGFVSLQKETSLISTIGPIDATRQAQIYSSMTFNFTSYLTAALLFVAITIPLARFTDYLLRRTSQRRTVGGRV
jgi:polar amino acid transport system permease protein